MLFVVNKSKEEMFDKFINRLHTEIDLHEINIIDEDQSDITFPVREDILDQGEDTLTFLGNYIEQIDTDLDRQQLKDFINKLYKEENYRVIHLNLYHGKTSYLQVIHL